LDTDIVKTAILVALTTVYIPAYLEAATSTECDSSEKIIFRCSISAKIALVCESKSLNNNFRYRYESPSGLGINFPAIGAYSRDVRLASHPTPGGSVSYIHFSNKGYDYYLIDDSSKNSDGSFSPFSKLVVLKGRKIVNHSICENDDAGISQDAYSNLSMEAYALPMLKSSRMDSISPR